MPIGLSAADSIVGQYRHVSRARFCACYAPLHTLYCAIPGRPGNCIARSRIPGYEYNGSANGLINRNSRHWDNSACRTAAGLVLEQ